MKDERIQLSEENGNGNGNFIEERWVGGDLAESFFAVRVLWAFSSLTAKGQILEIKLWFDHPEQEAKEKA